MGVSLISVSYGSRAALWGVKLHTGLQWACYHQHWVCLCLQGALVEGCHLWCTLHMPFSSKHVRTWLLCRKQVV